MEKRGKRFNKSCNFCIILIPCFNVAQFYIIPFLLDFEESEERVLI